MCARILLCQPTYICIIPALKCGSLFFFVGMLSKSKGQILRVAATMHVLFHWEEPQNIPNEISDKALMASINFVDICIQHAAYLAGRGEIQEAIDSFEMILSGMSTYSLSKNYT